MYIIPIPIVNLTRQREGTIIFSYTYMYPKQLFMHEWETKARRGRQRKTWGRMIDDIFASLKLDKSEWLEDIGKGEGSLDSYLGRV